MAIFDTLILDEYKTVDEYKDKKLDDKIKNMNTRRDDAEKAFARAGSVYDSGDHKKATYPRHVMNHVDAMRKEGRDYEDIKKSVEKDKDKRISSSFSSRANREDSRRRGEGKPLSAKDFAIAQDASNRHERRHGSKNESVGIFESVELI